LKDCATTHNALTHFDAEGNARMVDVGSKPDTERVAIAGGQISMSAKAYDMLAAGRIAKGDVLGVARVAGIMAAKKTPELIPLAHPIMINKVEIDFVKIDKDSTVEIVARVSTTGKTGVEMEALTSVSVAALTIYDMCKAVDKGMIIDKIRLLEKTGGKSGHYQIKTK
jgi:cyclic pyranopterin phosphate synthase